MGESMGFVEPVLKGEGMSKQELLSDEEEAVCNLAQIRIAAADFQVVDAKHTLTDEDFLQWVGTDSVIFRAWCNGEGREIIYNCANHAESEHSDDDSIDRVVEAYQAYRRQQAH